MDEGQHGVDPVALAAVAAGGASDAGGLDPALLGTFLADVVAAVGAGRPLTPAQISAYAPLGDRAARDGVPLRALLDLYLSAGWRLWRHLPAVVGAAADPAAVVVAGEVVLHAVDDAVAALAEGYQLARRAVVRVEEAARREVVDDLLTPGATTHRLVERAAGLGLDLAGPHAVALVDPGPGEPEFDDRTEVVSAVERAVVGSKGDAGALVATKQGRLVVVFAAPDELAVHEVTRALAGVLGRHRGPGRWRVGVGRPGPGAQGVLTSYRDAGEALDVAHRLGLPGRVVDAADLLVHQVLLRDREAITSLVRGMLWPLAGARGGARPLLDTLAAYLDAGGNGAAAARALHLSVRALTYRLARVAELTGHDPTAPEARFALHAAVLGARLLDWPATPLP